MSSFVNPDGSALVGGLLPSGVGEALQFDAQGNLKTTSSSASAGTTQVTTGGANTTAIAAAVATDTVVKATPGRIHRILVTAVGTTNLLIYDNAAGHTGTIIGIIKATAVVGDIIDIQMPAQSGITVAGAATNAGITLSWS